MESCNLLVSFVLGNWEVILAVHMRIHMWFRSGAHTLTAQSHG